MNSPLVKRMEQKYQDWLDRLPHLENDEARLLDLISKCYSSFLAGSADLKQLAVDFNLPVDIVAHWAREGKWLSRREDFRQELLVNVEMDYAEFVRRERVKTAEEIISKLQPKIGNIAEAIDTALSLGEYTNVRRLAESLKHVSDIVTKAVGLDAPLPQSERTNQARLMAADQTKQPFFNINTRGPVQITQAKEEKIVDVEASES